MGQIPALQIGDNMPAAHRHRDKCTGHGCWPPRPNVQASPNVFVNNKGQHRVGDSWKPHKCGKKIHAGKTSTGSGTVSVNGRAAARIGDKVTGGGVGKNSCKSRCLQGSTNVFIG